MRGGWWTRVGRGSGKTLRRALPTMAVAAILGVSAPGTVGAQILSPGRLAAPHAELEGLRRCTSCHELGKPGISPERCLSCHELIDTRIDAGRGYHAVVAQDCADCHQDHLGEDFDLRRLDEASFDHRDTGYPLEESHASAACRDCHRPELIADAQVRAALAEHDALERTFLGVADTCVSCHADADPHGDQFSTRSCADCHDPGAWDEPALFQHDRARFRLEGLHATVGCASCHATRDEVVRYRPVAFGSCTDCHADPHAGGMSGVCASCHVADGWTRVRAGSVEGRFDHGRTSFPLAGAHAAADCSACHRTGRPPSSELIRIRYLPGTAGATYPRPEASSCGSCHVDRHALPGSGGRWTECASCHSEARWAPTSFGVERHAASTFPLTGAHTVAPCWTCHIDQDLGHTRFTLALGPTDCAFCHVEDSPHEDLYSELACASCHVTEDFGVVAFDHAEVDAAPEGADCMGCHRSEDPHAGQFPDVSCAACHGTDAFVPVGPGFDHAETDFVLDGAHEQVPCASCHVPEEGPGGAFVRYRPLGSDCTDCHGGAS